MFKGLLSLTATARSRVIASGGALQGHRRGPVAACRPCWSIGGPTAPGDRTRRVLGARYSTLGSTVVGGSAGGNRKTAAGELQQRTVERPKRVWPRQSGSACSHTRLARVQAWSLLLPRVRAHVRSRLHSQLTQRGGGEPTTHRDLMVSNLLRSRLDVRIRSYYSPPAQYNAAVSPL